MTREKPEWMLWQLPKPSVGWREGELADLPSMCSKIQTKTQRRSVFQTDLLPMETERSRSVYPCVG